ncbi:quinone oxidoreductase family protein [Phenylobacterium deserti]|uniref:Quinone oxidoreductase n=1 Tax=Phenylobacterium deserti TaxID=1914756 RepID=A0A328AQM6_9CAUL|nr:quinone oxidoreductase [Phenylobacterium deserti]RAK57310.1 quinone oxidoreductase [Phenylobacterium deserti]
MRAVRFQRTGGPEVLEVVEVADPQPGPGEVLIRHAAIGVNFIDTYHRSGLYPLPLPSGLGSEGAGEVVAVGEGVTRFKVGDMAAYAGGAPGAYAELSVRKADRVVRVPAGIDASTAAAALLKGMTSEFLLRRCYPVQAGQTILVHAAAGGVGQMMVQWAKSLGAVVIGTVGSEDKAQRARELGCDHVILYREQDVAEEVRRITDGTGVPVAYDSVGRDTFEGTLASLGRRGMFVSFGNASGPAPAFEPARLQRAGSLFFTRPTLFDYVATTEELDASASALFEVLASRVVKVEVGQTFALAEAAAAHQALESRATIGATLLLP